MVRYHLCTALVVVGCAYPAKLADAEDTLRERLTDEQSGSAPAGVGTIESVREGTDAVVEEMTSSDEGECRHCGLTLPESGPPMCPRCGAPR
ncbi:MAG: hypothetical protein ABEH86_05775 [Haloarcula sp.]